jgi:hypothetical protein
MIFKTRPNIQKQFETVHDFGIQNLIVSGCSFTYNNHETSAVAWPYYLRDLGGFEQVLDCSLPGAGNNHIANSLQWAIEVDKPAPDSSLVIVMWSGCDRDDYICSDSNDNKQYPFSFKYTNSVISGICGGSSPQSKGNTIAGLKDLAQTKTLESRSIENYLYINGLWHYLKNLEYRFIFLNFLDGNLPSRTYHFDITKHLPIAPKNQYNSMLTKITDPHTWALKNDLLIDDDFHPSPAGHLDWTQKVLLPKLQTIIT